MQVYNFDDDQDYKKNPKFILGFGGIDDDALKTACRRSNKIINYKVTLLWQKLVLLCNNLSIVIINFLLYFDLKILNIKP